MSYQVYKVGGAVRDALLGKTVKDIDWVIVGATPSLLLSEGYLQVGQDFPVFLHPVTKEEYALARTERKQGHGYSGFEVFATPDVSLEDDLLRRDLTINAMAMDAQGTIIDPYNGQHDLNNRLLRHVSDAFQEDPLRVLRLARFYARFYDEGFTIADDTRELVSVIVKSGELKHLVAERIWLETHKALSERHAEQYFILLHELGALNDIFPMLNQYFSEESSHRLNRVFDALSLSIVNNSPMHIRVALLLSLLETSGDIKQFAFDYRLPSQEKVMAEKLQSWFGRFTSMTTIAEDWLELLLGLDAIRKPDQLFDFLACAKILSQVDGQLNEFLEKQSLVLSMYESILKIDVKSLINNVLPKDIPGVLAAERVRCINSLIKD